MIKKILTALVFSFILVSLLVSCGHSECVDGDSDNICDECGKTLSENPPKEDGKDGKIIYKITVTDPFGNPFSDMVVTVMNGDEPLAVKMTDVNGMVSCSEKNALDALDTPYTVTVADPKNSNFYYDESLARLSDGAEELTIVLYDVTVGAYEETLYINDELYDSVEAPVIDEGVYSVDLKTGRNYFVFYATIRGQYIISCDDEKISNIGYYGSPHFVQSLDIASQNDETADVFKKDGNLIFNIRAFNVGSDYYSASRYVVRIDSEADTKAFLSIKRSEDELPPSKEELPWEEYILASDPLPYVADSSITGMSDLTDFDVTNKNLKVVYNENDGFYHLGEENGPVILVKLTVDSRFLTSFKTIMETTRLSAYVYNEDGVLERKINYHGMMEKYIAAADENLGVYPLTQGIKEMLTVIGEAWGWYAEGGPNNIFAIAGTLGAVKENLYLFACCYYEE